MRHPRWFIVGFALAVLATVSLPTIALARGGGRGGRGGGGRSFSGGQSFNNAQSFRSNSTAGQQPTFRANSTFQNRTSAGANLARTGIAASTNGSFVTRHGAARLGTNPNVTINRTTNINNPGAFGLGYGGYGIGSPLGMYGGYGYSPLGMLAGQFLYGMGGLGYGGMGGMGMGGYGGYGGYGGGYASSPGYYNGNYVRYPNGAPAAAPQTPNTLPANNNYIVQGENDFKAGNYDGAVRNWRHALVDEPTNGTLVLMLAQALFASGKYNEAAGAVAFAMQSLPQDQWGMVVSNYPELYDGNDQFTNQLRALESASERDDTAAEHFLLGFEYGFLGYPQQAMGELDKSLAKAPNDPLAKQLRDVLAKKSRQPSTPPATPANTQGNS
jgi:Tfp pilus assembly protein PilF